MSIYRYNIESFDILFTNEDPVHIETNHINGIIMEKDYVNNYFPILKITLVIPPKLYFKILKNKLDVKFRFRLQKFLYDQNEEFQFKKDIINDVFCLFMDEDTPFLEEKQYELTKQEDESTSPLELNNEYSFYLFKEDDLLKSKKIINSIISSATMTETITYCFSIANIKKVLMSALDNKTKFEQIILPPMTLLGNLLFLEQQFGFFKTKMILFFDFDCIYLIDTSSKCKAWRDEEYKQTVFTVKEYTTPDILSTGCVNDVDEKKTYINIPPKSLSIVNLSVINDQIDGNNLMIINPNDGTVQTIVPETKQRGDGTYKIMVNNIGNEFSNNVAKSIKKENDTVINISINDYDYDSITPNKEFLFIFENQGINANLKGNYKINNATTVFIKQGNYFTIQSNCNFKKIVDS
jgi:hypothetical protein